MSFAAGVLVSLGAIAGTVGLGEIARTTHELRAGIEDNGALIVPQEDQLPYVRPARKYARRPPTWVREVWVDQADSIRLFVSHLDTTLVYWSDHEPVDWRNMFIRYDWSEGMMEGVYLVQGGDTLTIKERVP